jgi:hypothetical protein
MHFKILTQKHNRMITYKRNGIEVNGQFYSLENITNECNAIRRSEDNLVILELYWERPRSSDIYESRIYPKHIAKRMKEMMVDKQVYFGEIEGKHSEVFGVIEDHEIKIITKKKDIDKFLLENPTGMIFNHSFIDSFNDSCYDYGKEFQEEFEKLSSWEL